MPLHHYLRYRQFGIRHLFDPLIISAQEGCMKPDPEIYHTAIEKLGVPAEEILFVDDMPENVRTSHKLSMCGVVIDREATERETGLDYISNLYEIEGLI